MKIYCITIKDHFESERGFSNLVLSSKNIQNDFSIERFDAITPEKNEEILKKHKLNWNYPSIGYAYDQVFNIKKQAYKSSNQAKKISCALSHFLLWKRAIVEGPILILEHDAIFVKHFDPVLFLEHMDFYKKSIVSINSPMRATRKALQYHEQIEKNPNPIQEVPWIDSTPELPQGLPGGSAYIIMPDAASKVIQTIYETTGLWINDALLCKQIFNDILGVSKIYYTGIQVGLKSSTT